MDPQAVHCVRVVAAPDLRRVVKHAGVKTAAASAAAFDQKIGVTRAEPLQEIIEAEDVFVQDGSLIGGSARIDVRDAAVIVPFHVFDVAGVEHAADLTENAVDHILPRKIEH